jgi:ubiquinone/menaquinone biosynthesis C-methylase UbiE
MEMRREPTEDKIKSQSDLIANQISELPLQKGLFVKEIISQETEVKDLLVLDLGSGEGGTSSILSKENEVISIDIKLNRLKKQKKSSSLNKINGNAVTLPFKNDLFDLIILQDVIEHVNGIDKLLTEVLRVLKKGGYIYLSTPNKYSIINIMSDPHWGKPFVSLLNREQIKKYFLKYFRKSELNRNDIAQLFSLNKINLVFDGQFVKKINTDFAVDWLLKGNEGIIWSEFHKKLLRFTKILKADKFLLKAANKKYGIVNNFFTPTFYFLLKKK